MNGKEYISSMVEDTGYGLVFSELIMGPIHKIPPHTHTFSVQIMYSGDKFVLSKKNK